MSSKFTVRSLLQRHTGGRTSHRSRDSNTVQSNHANRHRQVLHFHIYIYIYIIYNHKNLYVQLIWQEIKWATLSKLHFVLFWGDFYHRDQILCRCWNVVKPLAMYDVTREGTCFTAYVCVVSVSAIVSHSLEKAAEMKENLNLFRQDRTPTGTRCGRTVKNRQEGSEQRQK